VSNNFIPQIGSKGVWKLLTPFDTALSPQTHYTCIGIRKLSDFSAAGEDAFITYYEPASLSKDTYIADLNNDVCIITLQQNSGSVVYVPSSYIDGFPDVNGYIYNSVVLAISLGALPETLDLTYIKSKIVDDVREIIGITSTVRTVVISEPKVIGTDDHNAITAARQANITAVKTDYANYIEAVAQRDSAYQKIQVLEQYIKDHLPHP
jgi:hypothetical protein